MWSNLATHDPITLPRRLVAPACRAGASRRRKRDVGGSKPVKLLSAFCLYPLAFPLGSTSGLPGQPNPIRANRAQSRLIVPNRAIFPSFDMTTDPKIAKFRNWQLPRFVRSDRSDRSDRSANLQSANLQSAIRNPQSAIWASGSRGRQPIQSAIPFCSAALHKPPQSVLDSADTVMSARPVRRVPFPRRVRPVAGMRFPAAVLRAVIPRPKPLAGRTETTVKLQE
jgi:hypothetical protein